MLNDPDIVRLVVPGLYLAPALVWSVLAYVHWTALRTRRPPQGVLPLVSRLIAFQLLVAT